MNTCVIQHEDNEKVVQVVKLLAKQYGIRGYDDKTHKGTLRHVVVRHAKLTDELMVVLVTKGEALPNKKNIDQALQEQLPNLKSIMQNINPKRTNVIFVESTEKLCGEDVIHDFIGDIKFAMSPRSFYQVNPGQTKVLYEKALEYAKLTGKETVIDAYCGIGTISLFLAQEAKQVYGVEIVPEVVSDAKRNAKINQIDNAEFVVGEVENVIPWWQAQGIEADVIVVDPPRKGCDEKLLETMAAMKPERIVYVSCNPATLARDLKYLEERGYKTKEVQPVDMFTQTGHIENVASIEREIVPKQ